MRLFATCSAILFLAGVLVGAYSCLEYQRVATDPSRGLIVQSGAVAYLGTVRGLPAEPGSNLAEALAGCDPNASACLLLTEDGAYYLCLLASRPVPPAHPGDWRTAEGQFEWFHATEGSPAASILTDCKLLLPRSR